MNANKSTFYAHRELDFKIREINAQTDKQMALLQQKYDLKCSELDELRQKHTDSKQMYEKLIEALQESDSSPLFTSQLKHAKELHLKEVIELKEYHKEVVAGLEHKVKEATAQREEALERVEKLEDSISVLKSENYSLSENGRLNKKELELKIKIAEYEKQKEAELHLEKFKQTNLAHQEEVRRLRERLSSEIEHFKNTSAKQIENLKSTHQREKSILEKQITLLEAQLKSKANSNFITETSDKTLKLEQYLQSIPSEDELNLSATCSVNQALESADLEDNCKFNTGKLFEENNSLKQELERLKTMVLPQKDNEIDKLNQQLNQKNRVISDLEYELQKTSATLEVMKTNIKDLKTRTKGLEDYYSTSRQAMKTFRRSEAASEDVMVHECQKGNQSQIYITP